ncbi:hypothetical protein [Candidatus Protofrankia californiensis]|uniref:hypothetical protein n=1 Tax=Candidatus Protofrankia californiensis TaxID=1839754 RepID=UPI0013EA3182|nr:hypothetical protein [Candidatus Protofrankia californiensis]
MGPPVANAGEDHRFSWSAARIREADQRCTEQKTDAEIKARSTYDRSWRIDSDGEK